MRTSCTLISLENIKTNIEKAYNKKQSAPSLQHKIYKKIGGMALCVSLSRLVIYIIYIDRVVEIFLKVFKRF